MCYSIEQRKPLKELEFRFKVTTNIRPEVVQEKLQFYHANGFAHPKVLVIPQENSKFMTALMWGLIPHWESGDNHKDYYKKTIKYGSGLNAKSEKLFSSNMYSGSALKRRCIVPLSGLHEPHHTDVVVKGSVFKVPFRFARKDDELMNVAGIYDFTSDGLPTFSILTKAATPLFSKIHNKKNRRPVILKDADINTWLDNATAQDQLQELIKDDMPDEDLTAYPIHRDLYRTKIDSNRPDILEKVDYKEVAISY